MYTFIMFCLCILALRQYLFKIKLSCSSTQSILFVLFLEILSYNAKSNISQLAHKKVTSWGTMIISQQAHSNLTFVSCKDPRHLTANSQQPHSCEFHTDYLIGSSQLVHWWLMANSQPPHRYLIRWPHPVSPLWDICVASKWGCIDVFCVS